MGERHRTAQVFHFGQCVRRASSQAGHVAALRLLDMAALRLLLAVGALATAHGALELTEDNWDSALAGKSAFVKFLAPW